MATVMVTLGTLTTGAVPAEAAWHENAKPAPPVQRFVERPSVAPEDRDTLLSRGWRSSADVLWTTSGDPTGLHLLVAEARTGYTWRTLATLAEPGIETDRWIGNVCFTGSGKRAVVVYAPRQFTNRERLFSRGGFGAIVDVESGKVRKLKRTLSLAYYNPGCGTGDTAVLTQSGLSDYGRTRLVVYDTARGQEVRSHELKGQVTSAVPVGDRIVAAGGSGLEEIDGNGRRRTLARTHGPAASVHPDTDGGVSFLEAHGNTTTVAKRFSGGQVRELARGPLTKVGLAPGTGGRVFLTGAPSSTARLPASVRRLSVPVRAEISTRGEASLTHTATRNAQGRQTSAASAVQPGTVQPVGLKATVTKTREQVDFQVLPGMRPSKSIAQGLVQSPARGGATKVAPKAGRLADYGGVTTDPVRGCAVARNDVNTQVYQPHWRQVEWAADLAVQGQLTVQRPANWKNSGLPAWSPQQMFPRIGLATGTTADHRVPAQIMLGVLAQESNMWQASPHALEGVYGNPLVGNFYGLVNEDSAATWSINWDESDCGYGVAQVTDRMRLADTSLSATQKRAIAMDYATNIAAGLRILEDKFNHTIQTGIRINTGNPWWIENWFAALWAYNTGMQPRSAEFGNTTGCRPSSSCHDGRGNWGLGWLNNPINPEYPPTRHPFLNGDDGEGSPSDAANPQDWPYQEKVMGWAAFPIIKENPFAGTWHPGYAQAWWTHEDFRTQVKPSRTLFCDQSNHCDPSRANPCLEADSHCWWNRPVVYKPNCLAPSPTDPATQMVSCGRETISFNGGAPEPADWNEWYKPNCSLTGVPAGSYVIDDVPYGMAQPRGCASGLTSSQGSFGFTFAPDATGQYKSKIDFHQIGGGFNGHFWFTHSRASAFSQEFKVTGTWKLNTALTNKWARVLVHVPDHGSETQQATYSIYRGAGVSGNKTVTRTINAKSYWQQQNHHWVSLGAFEFNGNPEISLSNMTRSGEGKQGWSGKHNVAWDAVAIQPLPRKPKNFVVAFGDSFSSGEGAVSEYVNGTDYDRETDMGGTSTEGNQNACHRSKWAWSRKATLKDQPEWLIGGREQNLDNDLDYHMVACSGAQTENVLAYGTQNEWGQDSTSQSSNTEVPQIESGFLDANTTLVTMSIGGNDVGWTGVLEHCAWILDRDCPVTTMEGDDRPLQEVIPERITTKVLPSVERVVQQIHTRAPNAKIILMGYPRLFSADSACVGSLRASIWDEVRKIRRDAEIGISHAEAGWLNVMTNRLAEQTELMATHMRTQGGIPVWFADPRASFDGHGLCSNPSAFNLLVKTYTPGESPDLRIPENPWFRIGLSAQSFHPNRNGTTFYATTLMDVLHLPGVDQ